MKISKTQKDTHRFKLLFENAPMPYQSLNEHGYFLDVNNKWLETLGYENKDKIIGTWFGDYLAPGFKEIFEKRFPMFKHACMIDGAEFDMLRKDGKCITVSFTGRIQFDENEDFLCTHCIFQDITRANQDKKALLQNEQRYRRLSDATFESIFISNKGICIEQNDTAERMFGYSHEEAIGNLGTDWIIQEDRKTVSNNILSGVETPYEVTALRKDGSTFPCEIQGRTIKDKDKTLRITALRDITSRKNAEAELRDSEERHRLIFENSPLSMIRFNKTGHIIDCNEKFVGVMGSTKKALIGFNTLKDSSPEMIKALQKAVNGQISVYEGIYTSVTGGRTAYLRAVFNPVAPDNPPCEVIGTVEDITDRKRVEADLAASEERFRLLAENAQDLIYRFSVSERKFEYMSPSCTQLTGYPPARFYKDPRHLFEIVHEDWLDEIKNLWHKMASGQTSPMTEYQIVHKSGQKKWLQQNNIPIYNENGNPIAVEGIVRDITVLKNALEKVEKERTRAEEASNTKSEFLANMSHEIRTPLNGIMGMLQLMQSSSPSPRQNEYIGAAMQASKRLNNVLSDILDLARVEAGKLSIQNTEFGPAEILQQTYDMFNLTSRQTGINLKLNITQNFPAKIIGDSLRLQQVLSNVVGNALKFTEQGSIQIEATKLPLSPAGKSRLLFIISDTGPGIPQNKLGKLFESFTQASKGYTREHQGVGLGLAICKKLVSLMGGSISVESKEGEGSSFYISIPFTNSVSSDNKKQVEQPVKRSPLEGHRILVAEDEKVNRLYTKRYLELAGCTVETVNNGLQALETLTYGNFDLILMDVQMPIMNGIETTKAIRRGEAGAHNKRMPIIAITAYAMADDKEKFIAAGMDDYIAKPVDQDELNKVIGKNLT